MREEERNAGRSEAWNPSRKERIILGTLGPRFMVVGKIRKKLNTLKQKKKNPKKKMENRFP